MNTAIRSKGIILIVLCMLLVTFASFYLPSSEDGSSFSKHEFQESSVYEEESEAPIIGGGDSETSIFLKNEH